MGGQTRLRDQVLVGSTSPPGIGRLERLLSGIAGSRVETASRRLQDPVGDSRQLPDLGSCERVEDQPPHLGDVPRGGRSERLESLVGEGGKG